MFIISSGSCQYVLYTQCRASSIIIHGKPKGSIDKMSDPNPSSLPSKEDSDGFFIWSSDEAEKKQVLQIGASACGATGIINVLVKIHELET